jgi:ferredoxin
MTDDTSNDIDLELDVRQEDCVACEICYEEAPEAFEDRGDGVAEVRDGWRDGDADEEAIVRAHDMCPTDCIEATVDAPAVAATQDDLTAATDGGEDEEGDEPDVDLEELDDDEIEERLTELEQLRTRVATLEDDYAEDTPTFEDRKENASGLAELTYEYFERSRHENRKVMDEKSFKEVALQPFWPHEMVRNLSIAAFFTGIVILLASLLPPHIASPANLSQTPAIILPDWYLYWSFGLLKLGPINPELAFLGGEKLIPDRTYGVLANLVVVGVIAVLPFLNPGTARRPVEEPFWASLGVGGVVFAFTISVLSVKNLVAEYSFMGFNISPGLLFDLTFLLPVAAALVTYPILKSFQKGYMYELNRRYYRLR